MGAGATSNDVFIARFNGLPDGSSGIVAEKWNGSGWGGAPPPIIEYNGTGWGIGAPSFVVKDNVIYIYYTDNGIKVITVDAPNANWPANIDQSKAQTVFSNDSAILLYGGKPGPIDVKYIDALERFVGFGISNEFRLDQSKDNYVFVSESADGIKFFPVVTSKVFWGDSQIQDRAHNLGVSGTREGHFDINAMNFIAYAFGKHQLDTSAEYKARWPTYMNLITVGLSLEPCAFLKGDLNADGN